MTKKEPFKTNMEAISKDPMTLAKFMAAISSDCAKCPMVKLCDRIFGVEGCSEGGCMYLLTHWLKEAYVAPKRPKIVAVDFDGTLCDSDWPHCGRPIRETIVRYLKEREQGTKFILWTNRVGDPLDEALFWCQEHGITFDAVNDNLPEVIEEFGNNCRKVFANEYWDDRMVSLEHLNHPEEKGKQS